MPAKSPYPRWARELVKEAKKRAKRRGQEFDLDVEFVLRLSDQNDHRCSLTNIPFDHSPAETYRRPFAPSLDRIDSTRGYTKDNVRLTAVAVNYAIGQFGFDILKQIAQAICSPDKNPPECPSPA